MIDLGRLKITIDTGAETAKKELNEVGETAEKQESKFKKFGEGLKKGAVIGAGAIVAAGAGLFKVANNAADAASNIDDMSQRTGVSAEAFQKYAYAAKLSGIEVGTLEKAMIKSQTAFADAKGGSEAMALSYQALGLDIENIGTSSEAFDLVIQRLAGMEDETQRNKIANDIFGKSYAELSPLLNEGADGIKALTDEAVTMGAVMSNDAVTAGAKFGDSIDSAKMAVSGIFNEIGAAFLPILQQLLEWVILHMPEIKKVIEVVFRAIKVVVDLVSEAFKIILPILTALYDWIAPYFPVIQSIFETTFKAIGRTVETVTKIFWNVVDAIKSAIDWLNSWNKKDAKKIDVGGSGNNISYDGSHANGLDYVPYDNYIANLHKGERVLTANENKNGQSMKHSGTITVKGVNNSNELQGVVEVVMDQLRREVRFA